MHDKGCTSARCSRSRAAPASLAARARAHPFGVMLGKDGRPFRSRDGGLVKLVDLLDEAQQRAFDLVSSKNPALSDDERRDIARAVGIGAVKYADLSKHRTSDYIFDWDTMRYLTAIPPASAVRLHAHHSLFRKGQVQVTNSGAPRRSERRPNAPLLALARYQDVEDVAVDALPHHLCGYLYELAARYMQFYEQCPVLTAAEPLRNSRLLLCRRVADTLRDGLGLLGIETVDRM
jgi:arginyl-tRNA synthetase